MTVPMTTSMAAQPLPAGRYGLESSRYSLELRFDVRMETIEGILALTQEWAGRRKLSRDDRAGLRLLLEELLLNIRFHAASGRPDDELEHFFITMSLGLVRSEEPRAQREDTAGSAVPDVPPDRLRITLRDPGPPFNPLSYPQEAGSSRDAASPGGRGLALVRLFSMNRRYLREEGHNVLSLEMLLGAAGMQTESALAGTRAQDEGARQDAGIWRKMRRAWREKLALRQTALFAISAAVLFWSCIGIYYASVAAMRADNAETLAMQSMATQDELSVAFLKRVEGGLAAFARGLTSHPGAAALLGNDAAFLAALRQGSFFRPFTTETPVIGIVLGKAGQKEARLFHLRNADIVVSRLPDALAGLNPLDREGMAFRWHGPVFGIPDKQVGRHAAMFYGLPAALPGQKAEHWLGVVIGMPWIENTLRGLSGFEPCAPIFTNDKGAYVIFPPGRAAGQGPQNIFEDAAQNGLPSLAELGRRMAAGERGLRSFADGLETSGGETVWPLPWREASTLIYYPMSLPGWRFAMAVPDSEIGNALPGLPLWLLLLGLLGPALLGAVTWHATTRTLGPLRELTQALENLGNGDLDTPFPTARRDDETGRMLAAFERTRIILKASFRSQVRGATAQQRMRNELALARSVQESMLPAMFPAVPGMDMAARVDVARDVCGDLYDCFLPDPSRKSLAACVVGDVCGKGIPAALVMSRVMPLARSALLRGLSPARALEQINAALLRQDGTGMFVTLLIGLFDSTDGSFTWACAGHPPPLLGPVPEKETPPEAPAWSNSLVLGVQDYAYAERTLHLAPGQSLLLYTDGASEAMGPAEPGWDVFARTESTEGLILYGEERLASSFTAACLAAAPEEDAATAILNATRDGIVAHMAGMPPFDDISLMVLRRVSEKG